MNTELLTKARYFTVGLILSLGYSIIANGFLTKLIASADYAAQGFPFVIASDPYIATLIIILSMAMGVASAMIIPNYTSYCYLKFNEYIQRLLNQMPEKNYKQKKHMLKDLSEDFWSFIRSKSKTKEKKTDVKPDRNSDGGADPWNNKE